MSLVEFNEWYGDKGEKLHIYRDEKWIAKYGFEAGQQSQQVKIDELQTRIEKLLDYTGTSGHTPNWIIKEFLKWKMFVH